MELRYRNGIELSHLSPTLPKRHRADPSKNPHKCAKTQRSVARLYQQLLEQRGDEGMRSIYTKRVALQQHLEGIRNRLLPFLPPADLSAEPAYVMDRQLQQRNARHAHEDTVLGWRMEHTKQSLRARFADRFAQKQQRLDALQQLSDAHLEGRNPNQTGFDRSLELWEGSDTTDMRVLSAHPHGDDSIINARWKTFAVNHSEFEHDVYRT